MLVDERIFAATWTRNIKFLDPISLQPVSHAVWRTLVERLKIDLILATESILRRSTFTTCESADDVAKRPRQKTV